MDFGGIDITVERLRSLIGVAVRHAGVDCRIIEVLEDGPSLVLQSDMGQSIQPDQYGEAHRWVPYTLTIPIFTEDKTELNPDFLSLGVIDLD
ncbi:MAG TPA: hypothetical protein VKA13_07050, partial [Gammaproteobacteria bacterium]|nr:hypothetical protein [Gammaproteobacteria bacterium]